MTYRYPPPDQLPTVSVVFCFAEEMWSTLLRSVWSVLDRTPRECLVEIILIDDASVEPWLQADFKKYVPLLMTHPLLFFAYPEDTAGVHLAL